MPFPLIILLAGLVGGSPRARSRRNPRRARSTRPTSHVHSRSSLPAAATSDGRTTHLSSLRVAALGGLLWALPALAVGFTFGFDSIWSRVYLFFTQAALVTFGGAYAVLGYVTSHLVADLHWLTAQQSVDGLALAETTPGPLVIVLQFMGYMTGWNQPGALTAPLSALLAGMLAAWATFLPSFVFIFLGAPYIERLSRMPKVSGALAAITAAVVGIIATLAVLLARVVLSPNGLQHAPDWIALAIGVVSWWLLERTRLPLPWVLVLAAGAGLLASVVG